MKGKIPPSTVSKKADLSLAFLCSDWSSPAAFPNLDKRKGEIGSCLWSIYIYVNENVALFYLHCTIYLANGQMIFCKVKVHVSLGMQR